MKKIRFLIFALCLCMLLPLLIACGNEEKPEGPNDQTDLDGETRETAKDTIPDGYDLENQTITIWFHGQKDDALGIEGTTDIVFSKIHERNLSVQERLNVDLQFMEGTSARWQDSPEELRREIQTMSCAFEAVFAANNRLIGYKLFNYFHDLNDSNYIDLNEDWWYEDAIMELAVDNYNYRFLYGDLHISNIGRAGTVYYNKELYSQYVSPTKEKDELYQVVLDGKWTLDEFTRLAKKGYVSKGGDGSNDIYGYDHHQTANMDFLRESVGIRLYDRNDQGMPIFNFKDEKSVAFITKINDFFHNSPGILASNINKSYAPVFTDSQVLFQINILSTVMNDAMREMKDDFGILPMPKWDEEQEEYKTLIYSASCTAGIPVSTDIDRANEEVSAVIEALCSESYRSVSLAFYETALKAAYNRDDQSAQMIDIITAQHPTVKSTLTKNFVFEYSSSLGNIGSIFTTLAKERSNNFVSQYDSIIGSAEQGLRELIDLYKSGKI
ncbi:MAG: hypothetical protein IJV70_05585 [Clostridia bacterium]|nr:hypothetical protein [Clostridia bacterium]